jgi:hypothetical protein
MSRHVLRNATLVAAMMPWMGSLLLAQGSPGGSCGRPGGSSVSTSSGQYQQSQLLAQLQAQQQAAQWQQSQLTAQRLAASPYDLIGGPKPWRQLEMIGSPKPGRQLELLGQPKPGRQLELIGQPKPGIASATPQQLQRILDQNRAQQAALQQQASQLQTQMLRANR